MATVNSTFTIGWDVAGRRLKHLPAPVRTGFLDSLAVAISQVFGWAILFAVAVPVLAVFLKEVPLRGRDPRTAVTPRSGEDISAANAAAHNPTENSATAAAE